MPALQNLSIVDRESTPVTHTFTPRDVKDGTGLVVRSTGVPASDEKFALSMRKSGSKFKGKINLAVPVVQTETINGVSRPVTVRTAYATLEFIFDEMSTTQERTNLVGMLADSLGTGKTLVHDTIVGLGGVYG